jgi:hypothetical protein
MNHHKHETTRKNEPTKTKDYDEFDSLHDYLIP